MTKTIHALLSHYLSITFGEGRGHCFEGGAYFTFRPIGGALIQRGCLFKRGPDSKIHGIINNLKLHRMFRLYKKTTSLALARSQFEIFP